MIPCYPKFFYMEAHLSTSWRRMIEDEVSQASYNDKNFNPSPEMYKQKELDNGSDFISKEWTYGHIQMLLRWTFQGLES
jgi:hypothetical protein